MQIEIEILSKETIKPYHATPSNKEPMQSSLLDQLSPHIYTRVIFFYLHDNNTHKNPQFTSSNITNLLKISLSKTLTKYYPFAGRVNSDNQIDCNDKGVDLDVGFCNCRLFNILQQPESESVPEMLPISGNEALNGKLIDSLVKIQITHFKCGGISIGGCFSHKVADASSIATFMNDWATMTQNPNFNPCPQFIGGSYFPTYGQITLSPILLSAHKNCLTKRVVFNMSKINSLLRYSDEKMGGLRELNPTRVETVSGLICRSILGAYTSLSRKKPEFVNVIVNLRTRMRPTLLGNHIGNFALHNLVEIGKNDMGLHGIVCDLKEGMSRFCEEFVKDQDLGNERSLQIYNSYKKLGELSCDMNVEMLLISSWCRFPFYEVDFGFGKPGWVSFRANPIKNCIFLCDARVGDDIEAWVTLEDQIMEIFELDKELLDFACVNPSPL
ncbi:tabersonine-19-hydroxy-O-acetyltransferase-like [Silene latifolia]|uniref:tabersonine-19-hydroxy-O-acetyltransferase-like n=1 Tax=Silene latifolia TaxID=37657 RepID=UPI003D77F54F